MGARNPFRFTHPPAAALSAEQLAQVRQIVEDVLDAHRVRTQAELLAFLRRFGVPATFDHQGAAKADPPPVGPPHPAPS